MPHDKHGDLLEQGDIVTVECEITGLTMGEEYCNVTLRTTEPMYPGDSFTTITANAKQTRFKRRPPLAKVAPAT